MKLPHHIIGFTSLLIMLAGLLFLTPTGQSQVSLPETDAVQDGSASSSTPVPPSNPSTELLQDAAISATSSVISNPSADTDQDGRPGLLSNPSSDPDQDGPALASTPTTTPTSTLPVTTPPVSPIGGSGGGGGGSSSGSVATIFPPAAGAALVNQTSAVVPTAIAPARTTSTSRASAVATSTIASIIAEPAIPPLFDITSDPIQPAEWSLVPYMFFSIILLILIILLLLYLERRARKHLMEKPTMDEAIKPAEKMPEATNADNPYLDKIIQSQPVVGGSPSI